MSEPSSVDDVISDASRFYADRLQAMSHSSYDLQANAPSEAAIRAAWERQANERNEAETFKGTP